MEVSWGVKMEAVISEIPNGSHWRELRSDGTSTHGENWFEEWYQKYLMDRWILFRRPAVIQTVENFSDCFDILGSLLQDSSLCFGSRKWAKYLKGGNIALEKCKLWSRKYCFIPCKLQLMYADIPDIPDVINWCTLTSCFAKANRNAVLAFYRKWNKLLLLNFFTLTLQHFYRLIDNKP